MKYLLKDLLTFRTGCIVNMTVWDSFDGKVKIIKNRCYKWLIEVIDVSMCYSCQRQLKPGERMWVYRKELFRDEDEYKPKRRKKKYTSFDDEDLPF